jgi:hypothetical protein
MNIYHQMAVDTLANGGGTYARDAFRPADLPNRYVVALGTPWDRVATITEDAGTNVDELTYWTAEYLRELANIAAPWQAGSPFATEHNPKGLGTWPANNTVHVDIVESYSHGGYALALARDRGQKAIWDQREGVAIEVPQ